ncbi:MAG: hypothetical protein RIB67_12045 [Miltoncostaeaceae bacterium]
MTAPADIVNHCALHLDDADIERLVGWIAWRTGRNQALAGDGPAISRLEHVVTHWLDDGRRADLVGWLIRRRASGRPAVPE